MGYGKAAQLGKLKFESVFCIDPATFVYGKGTNTYGRFIFDNGDVLNLLVEGQVLLSDHPKYDAEFQDEIEFIGGTGRFDGAYGSAITNSFVTFFPDGTDSTIHHWKGTLYLPAAK